MDVKEKTTSNKIKNNNKITDEITRQQRVVIENVTPQIDGGHFPIKRSIGETVSVLADVFTEGHTRVSAYLLYRKVNDQAWKEVSMEFLINDRWEAVFPIESLEDYVYTVKAWVNDFVSWREGLTKKWEASQDVSVELTIGMNFIEDAIKRCQGDDQELLKKCVQKIKKQDDSENAITVFLSNDLLKIMETSADRSNATLYSKELRVLVDREKALFSSWYEIFPRSWSNNPGEHGTFKDCQHLLPEIASMGFDVLYLPPIHPIGETNRKGKNNSVKAEFDDPGSPWAIGSKDGGHKEIHPQLGSLKDFQELKEKSKKLNIELAIDMAFQCTPDHPYVKKHPKWFKWRPDGTIQYAENPPKKYEDIYPLNFESEDWQALWQELKSIFIYWIEQGIRIFRVDNPHTKPFAFWDWVINEIRKDYPETIFLAEAFTRPKVMKRLAKGGFTQSYTYFTWRNTKRELTEYLTELTQTDAREYFRPNFWTNTPDILPEHLQYGGKPAFMMRVVLAATLSSNYGMYGPAFELCVSEAVEGKEEYLNSEKYEIKKWDRNEPNSLKDFVTRVNQIRRENPAFHTTWNLKFGDIDNEQIFCYWKADDDLSTIFLIVVNLDPYHNQSGWITVPLKKWGIDPSTSFLAHDLLSNDKYIWQGERNYIELNPTVCPAHILKIHSRLRREQDFDYFM